MNQDDRRPPEPTEENRQKLSTEKEVAANLLRLAEGIEKLAQEITPWLRAQSGNPDSCQSKADGTQVTSCDLEMERRFREVCDRALDISFVFLGEESEALSPTPVSVIAEAKHIVICDPIDGTANFIAGNGLYGCLIGVYERIAEKHFAPVFGAVLQPEQGKLYITEGDRVLEIDVISDERRVLTAAQPQQSDRLSISAYPPQKRFFKDGSYDHPELERVISNASIEDIVRLIRGDLDASLISGKWWDVAALMAVLEKLGFDAISLRDGEQGFQMRLDQLYLDGDNLWGLREPLLIHHQEDRSDLLKHFKTTR